MRRNQPTLAQNSVGAKEPTKKFLTLEEASKATGRTYWKLREAVHSGHLRATQFSRGGTIYIKPEDLDRYFEANVVNPVVGRIK